MFSSCELNVYVIKKIKILFWALFRVQIKFVISPLDMNIVALKNIQKEKDDCNSLVTTILIILCIFVDEMRRQ